MWSYGRTAAERGKDRIILARRVPTPRRSSSPAVSPSRSPRAATTAETRTPPRRSRRHRGGHDGGARRQRVPARGLRGRRGARAQGGRHARRRPRRSWSKSKTYVATVSTTCGDFQITLDAKRAPITGGSFKYLADEKFYDGLTFHRIVPDFVIQGGDPAGSGNGGPGYSVEEAPPSDLKYTKGIVAMAKTAGRAAGHLGSQFFVVTGDGRRAADARLRARRRSHRRHGGRGRRSAPSRPTRTPACPPPR